MNAQKRLLVFHPTIAPYRIDFFNDLSKAFQTRVCLKFWNLRDQTFNYRKIYARFAFRPVYLKEWLRFGGRSFSRGYWKQLDKHAPDLVLTEEFSIGTVCVLLHRFFKRKKYKVVTLCDDSYDMVAEKNDFSRLHRLARRYIAPLLDDIIVVHPQVRKWYQKRVGKGYFFPIIQNEEQVRENYRKVVERGSHLRKIHALENRKIFLFVGRLVELKNVETLVRAFAGLDQKKYALVIVGDGPELKHLQRLSRELHLNILFTGRLEGDALNAWYNVADVFVLPSYQEAFGAVTNEALLAGCYVLVSTKAGSSCLVVESENGYTFQPMEVDTLCQKMEKVGRFPNLRESDGLKRNRMKLSYRECMDGLVAHLNALAHG